LLRNANLSELYPAYNLSVPIDHFHKDSKYEPHSAGYFNLRYFFDASHYVKGGPIIVLQGGEGNAFTQLGFLKNGIVSQLAKATGGISVILEHRYYGTSFPVPDLTTHNLRFLTTDQALADQVYFAQNIVFPGREDLNLTAPSTPYIAYGCSYAGGLVAFLRVLYPGLYWGSISSSGVTEAIYDYWQYYEPIREYGPPECISTQQKLINVIDTIFQKNDSEMIGELKTAFGVQGLVSDDDAAGVMSQGFQGWQSLDWNTKRKYTQFGEYCDNITSDDVQYSTTESLASTVQSFVEASRWSNESSTLTNRMLNMIGFTNETFIAGSCGEESISQCWSYTNASAEMYTVKTIRNYSHIPWAHQCCTQWGYMLTGSGVPADKLPLISRLLTLEYRSLFCKYLFNITTPPDTEAINKYGGFNISYPRLAIIGGEQDPWRPATPLAELDVPDRLNTTSTADQPVILVEDAVHCWDATGSFPNKTTWTLPPQPVRDAQAEIVQFVQEWMAEWKRHCINNPEGC